MNKDIRYAFLDSIDVQLTAIQALGKIDSSEAKKSLGQCLENPSDAIRQAAKQALDQLEAEENPLPFRIRNTMK